ncbi:IRK-interacting protein-like [Punica granatum]|uniref:Uncharacterized protein n=2 Tax=Punica granatum TaxID=22663 RepID=A0A218XUT6_PUNGR|nr:IRK-interacting protein-like [Punica granatum]OWM88406.1 hypothetical protein CDL15_Pgr003818 [Punica granatum]PKI49490.1 hypothetical protein CRG98_030107 [Punica granatum]
MTMAPPPPLSSPPSSSKSPPPPPSPAHPPGFSPIQEAARWRTEENRATAPQLQTPINRPPHPKKGRPSSSAAKKRAEQSGDDGEDGDVSVKCNKCRPHAREKITIVPLDNNGGGLGRHSLPSPNGILKSILSSLTKKSPRPGSDRSDTSSREEQWKIALAELSHKLIHATRRRDEAILEASRLKHSVAELERKLNKLEIYCQNLRSGLEECTSATGSSPFRPGKALNFPNEQAIDRFLVSVSEARSAVRVLSRSLTMQLRHIGPKVFDKLSQLLQPYDIKISPSQSPRTLIFYLEAILNRSFYEDFESARFEKNRAAPVLNPTERCEANLVSFNNLRGLTWDEVLSKGTKHFSEDFSRFCDRKMSEIVGMLGWARAWPEPLLQAFFGASKAVWLVHLLANSVHPGLPIMRVDSGVRFDSGYMEDMGADRARKLVPSTVRIMVATGFYVYSSVVKCKVLCRYYSSSTSSIGGGVSNFSTDERGIIIQSP